VWGEPDTEADREEVLHAAIGGVPVAVRMREEGWWQPALDAGVPVAVVRRSRIAGEEAWEIQRLRL
jgi:hypothetical protein